MTSSRRALRRQKGWRWRDYLYHFLGLGENVELARKSAEHQHFDYRSGIEIALIAETETDAKRLMNSILQHCSKALPIDEERCGRLNFIALGLDQAWPSRSFDELHWLGTSPENVMTWAQLSGLADTVHIHHFSQAPQLTFPHARNYQWRSQQELTAFWASMYLAREINSIPGLKWDSYESWSPGSTIGQAAAGWGATPSASVASLLADSPPIFRSDTQAALLMMESNHDFTLGDYAYVLEHLGKAIGCHISPAVWLTKDYSGYGLKLLVFSPP